MGELMAQVFGQPAIGRMTKAPIQQAIQGGFQPPRGHGQTLRGNSTLLVAVAQPESLLQQGLDRPRELGGGRGGNLDHLAATSDQVLQAALMKRLLKSIETTGAVMHQKAVII